MAKTALITGASAGLGLELAQLFAADKHDVVLVARRRDQLEALATRLAAERGVVARVIAADLADPGAPQRIVDELERRNIEIEFLVNNAGFGTTGPFVERDLLRELAMVQVNVTSLVHLTGLLLPGMVARRSGRILNLGSTAGFQPGPFMAVYYATKAFVNSFTEALSYELRGTGVTATVSCPGATATEFGQIAGNDRSRLFQVRVMKAPDVAAHASRAMLAGRPVAVPGLLNKLVMQMLRFGSRGMIRGIAARLNEDRAALTVRKSSGS
jgi:short-subunit dehydrogenase